MNIDLARRRRVMDRSILLGHCICDPRRPCPCDVFREQGICPCAGERPDPLDPAQIKLTALVRNAGCASKIAPADLEAVLARLPQVRDPAVLSGLAAADDAAIYRLAPDLCLVQTVDVFTPCVDDPWTFGRICAANCLSDIYAMGGEPRTALSILGFPSETLPGELMYQMLSGAMATLGQAGVALIGGHSLKDDEIKLGFAVTGTIDPEVAAALDHPAAGDVLVLTKPLGTGVLAFAQQIGRGHPPGASAATEAMATLNRAAAEAMREAGASACTDITGFGLFGHLLRLLRPRHLTATIFANALPAFDGVLEALRNQIIPGALERNREFVGEDLEAAPTVDAAHVHLGFDAQTSGGLLIAIPPSRLSPLLHALNARNVNATVIGRIDSDARTRILVCTSDQAAPTAPPTSCDAASFPPAAPVTSPEPHAPGCCADVCGTEPTAGTAADSQRAFGALMRSTQAAGALTERAKELILFGLVLHSRCEPCFDAHYERARELGITQSELDEAAWCAIAMGGAPVKVFYQQCLRRLKNPGG